MAIGVSALLMQSCGGGGTDVSENDVPVAVRTAFINKFPEAKKVDWERATEKDRVIYKAEFKGRTKEMKATFDQNGGLIKADED